MANINNTFCKRTEQMRFVSLRYMFFAKADLAVAAV